MSTGQDMSVQEKLKGTLNLPTTNFPIRPQAAVDDPRFLHDGNKKGSIVERLSSITAKRSIFCMMVLRMPTAIFIWGMLTTKY